MYKNIYYDRYNNKIHLWTTEGYEVFTYEPYVYLNSEKETNYKSIFGQYVEKVKYSSSDKYLFNNPEYKGFIHESDVNPEVRTLIDRYYEDDSIPECHNIIALDIEVSRSKTRGYAKPPDVYNFITAITLMDIKTKETHSLVLDPFYKSKNNHDFVKTYPTEQGLLKAFIDLWNKIKPTVITGWNTEFYDIPYLYLRIQKELGRSKANSLSPIDKVYLREADPEKNRFNTTISLGGISHLDYLTLYKNYKFKNQPSYKLDSIAEIELGKKKIEYEGDLHDLWENDINKFIDYNFRDVELISDFEDKLGFLNLHMKMSHISHVPYEFALSSVRLIEGKFLTEAKKRNLVLPDIPEKTKSEIDKILGAFVKQSKKGLFEYLFDLDLTSLYPMIIATLNISLETKAGEILDYIDVWLNDDDKVDYEIKADIFREDEIKPDRSRVIDIKLDYYEDDHIYELHTIGDLYDFLEEKNCSLSSNGILFSKDVQGEAPRIILELFNIRSEYKKLRIKADKEGDTEESKFYDLMQMAFKIFINSIYGVFCNEYFRLTDKDNAQSITLTGQFVNKSGMDSIIRIHHKFRSEIDMDIVLDKHVELFDDPIITGDTDSIILSAVPSLYYQYGEEWLSWDEDKVMDEVMKISKIMAEIVNDRSEIFAKEWLNTDKNYLEFKEEWVARSGFYIGVKKRYANWIRRKEGAPSDFVDIKGLDVIRSSFPKHLQDFLKNILYDILKFVDKDKIYDYIVDVRDDLIENSYDDIEVISHISSANNLSKYSDSLGQPIKGAPFHVKGALNFNKYIQKEQLLNKQQEIFEGDKIRVVYLKNNQYGFDVISYPISDLSDEMEKYIQDHIDSVKSIDKLLDKKLNKYYNAMDWNPPNTKFEDISELLIDL